MSKKIRIVLVNTSHPGNIGGAARAMKNMGLSELYLVNPAHFPDYRATIRASGADDVLEKAVVVELLLVVMEVLEVVDKVILILLVVLETHLVHLQVKVIMVLMELTLQEILEVAVVLEKQEILMVVVMVEMGHLLQ